MISLERTFFEKTFYSFSYRNLRDIGVGLVIVIKCMVLQTRRKHNTGDRAFFNCITGAAIAPRGIGFAPRPVAIILPPESLLTWFPVNTSKRTKELFSSNHAILFSLSA